MSSAPEKRAVPEAMTELARFVACMEYRSADRRPNHELGAWPQTKQRWEQEAPDAVRSFTWNWFVGEPGLGLDHREYVPLNYGFIPPFPAETIEDTPEYQVFRDSKGILHRALKEGTVGGGRMCMDQYLDFPVKNRADFLAIKKRLIAADPSRIPADIEARLAAWRQRTFPLCLGTNCAANGFYWRARE